MAVTADCPAGQVGPISIRNLPSFADRLDVPLDVPGLGTLTVDTAFGGDSFVIVAADDAEVPIEPGHACELATLGMRIVRAANEQIGFRHPTLEGVQGISNRSRKWVLTDHAQTQSSQNAFTAFC